MEGKRKINVLVADRQYPITVHTDQDEALFRKAGRHVNNRLIRYRSHFANEPTETLLAMVALEAAYDMLCEQERNDAEPFKAKLQELTAELEAFFKENTRP